MAYTKTLWKTGDIVTEEKMNKIEQGIESMELPTVTSEDDGKTLVVENGAWALGSVSGGSSGGGVFVVKMTQPDPNENVFVLDKTWQEIKDAMPSNICVVIMTYDNLIDQGLITQVSEGSGRYTVKVVMFQNGTAGGEAFAASSANEYPTLIIMSH